MARDMILFARQLLSAPLQVSAVLPSSRFLARAMAAGLGPDSVPVVEFGPGLGHLTKGLLQSGITPGDLILVERNAHFAHHLADRFPGAHVHRASAQDAANLIEPGSIGTVISGLPLLSMPPSMVRAILLATFTILRPNGSMRQFTYGAKPPFPDAMLNQLGLVAIPFRTVWANVPPARIFIVKRAHEL